MPPRPIHRIHTQTPAIMLGKLGVICLSGIILLGLSPPKVSPTPQSSPQSSPQTLPQTTLQTPAQASASEPNTPAPRTDDTESSVQECVVTFLTGRKLTGILMDSNDEHVVLRINGIDTTYRRARIASVRFLDPIDVRYRSFRKSISDEDIDGRLMLVDWLRERRAYALAIQELDSILELEPNNPQAKLLKTWLEQHQKLSKSRKSKSSKPSKPRIPTNKSTIPLLTMEQVNLIRVFEIDIANPPDFTIKDSTIRTLITRSPSMFPADEREREAIFKWPQIEKLKLLFRHRARDLYTEIRVHDDPANLKTFQQQIGGHSGWLINGCATARCHGGDQAGEFRLSNHKPNSPETLYTNFLILNQFKLRNGTPLIDYTDAERSPLMHMGLVRSRSLYPHPDVDAQKIGRDWRAVFRTTTSINFKRTTDWIRTLFMPRPDYGFVYPPPPPPSEGSSESSSESSSEDSP